ncbi:hypothetical protein [Marinisporobacter balticus]|uniref:Uncharacterized protein n=1 Tax=Marinisporobacter balticus TaxID=2018667 RepID=A0A4R2L708_9FIRM|nr:hypothetical protein [Marinisporobacter balticus]TCO79776.1 hypothetical protein EV214_1016 [Marinisporobacter balticus]
MKYGMVSIILLLIFLIGYAFGRRIGIKEGYERGMAYIPLKSKEKVYEDYSCPLGIDEIEC